MFLFNNTLLFGAIVVLSTVVVFWVVIKAVEKVPFIKGNLDTHSQIEKITAKHFRELKLIGALILQVNFCLLLLGYCLFFELSNLYCLVITEWYFSYHVVLSCQRRAFLSIIWKILSVFTLTRHNVSSSRTK